MTGYMSSNVIYPTPLLASYIISAFTALFVNNVFTIVELEKCLVATEFGSERDPAFVQFKIDNMTKIISKIHG